MSTEITKMKQGMSYSRKEKTIILNVFKYFKTQFPDECVTEIVRKTAKATGCSEKSVFQFRKEEASAEGFKVPSKTKQRKNININSRDIKYGSSVRQSIKQIIHDLKSKNKVPTLNAILRIVRLDSELPNFSLMTLRRLLFDMGFSYKKEGNKKILVEDSNNPHDIIGKIKKHRIKSPSTNQDKITDFQTNTNTVPPQISNQNSFNTLPKPTPQHPVGHSNMHMEHVSQTIDYQPPHNPMMHITPPFSTYNYPIMNQSTMHLHPPRNHDMHPVVLNHRPHQTHIIPSTVNMHPEGDQFPERY